jgi:hypothetical protein
MQLRVIAAHSHGRIAQVRGLNWQSSRDYPVRAARKPIDNQVPRADVNNNNDGQIRKTSLLIFAKCKLKVRGQQSPSRPELGVVVMAGGLGMETRDFNHLPPVGIPTMGKARGEGPKVFRRKS